MELIAMQTGILVAVTVAIAAAMIVVLILEWRAATRRAALMEEFSGRFTEQIENLTTNMKEIGVGCEDAMAALEQLRVVLRKESE